MSRPLCALGPGGRSYAARGCALLGQFIAEHLEILSYIEALAADTDGVLAGMSAEDPDVEIGPDDIGTLSFTSGSTGIPKGAAPEPR